MTSTSIKEFSLFKAVFNTNSLAMINASACASNFAHGGTFNNICAALTAVPAVVLCLGSVTDVFDKKNSTMVSFADAANKIAHVGAGVVAAVSLSGGNYKQAAIAAAITAATHVVNACQSVAEQKSKNFNDLKAVFE